MLQSELFTRTSKTLPKDERSKSAQLLIRAGFIDKLASGVYTFLPLGFLVLNKLEKLISDEMERVSGQRVIMPALIPKDNWQETKRWDNFDALFKLKEENVEYGLGATHEEVVVPLVKKYVSSYKDLPFSVFQIQNKFRNEKRAKSGILRTREFLMKDLYSFHATEKDLDSYYEKVKGSYLKIFRDLGISKDTYFTLASGGTFSGLSHEFQTITEAGEDEIFICNKCKVAVNSDVASKRVKCFKCGKVLKEVKKSIEVGNIFKLGDKYSKAFGLEFVDSKGEKRNVLMGTYGIGLPRLIGAVVEVLSDENGIVWPDLISPFSYHLIQIENKVKKEALKIYRTLQKLNLEVIYDDRIDKSPGEKFTDCDLIGVSTRIVVSKKTLAKNSVELKLRREKKKRLVKIKDLSRVLTK